MPKPELLAPAGDMAALHAAVACGADAVYFGGRMFGARASASNFTGEVLEQAVEYCHLRNVKAYMTINTLVKDDEFAEVYAVAKEAVLAGVDAVLVQDLGVMAFLQAQFDGLELHASTQMSINNRQGAQMAKRLGLRRVVAAREASLDELQAMVQTGIEIESFCHGALCASFSGQCLMSSLIGGRSGNRGRCAQPCRQAYTLNGETAYHLSTKDISTAYGLPALTKAGIASLKIEGRLKRPEYVAIVTGAYRHALDQSMQGKPVDEKYLLELKKIFNRGGFSKGYAGGAIDGEIYYAKRQNHLGVPVGKILVKKGQRVLIKEDMPLHVGDGLEARDGLGDGIGIVVERIDRDKNGDPWIGAPNAVREGMPLFRTTDAEQLSRAREMVRAGGQKERLNMVFCCHVGKAASLTIGQIKVEGQVAEQATCRPITAEKIQAQLEKLGDTAFLPGDIQIHLDDNAFLPLSAVNALRREALQLYAQDLLAQRHPKVDMRAYAEPCFEEGTFAAAPLRIAKGADAKSLALADADALYYAPRDYRRQSLSAALSLLPPGKSHLVLPAFLTSGELDEIIGLVKETGLRAVANNLGQVYALKEAGLGFVTGEGLNVLNLRSALFLRGLGAERVMASLECTLQMAGSMAAHLPIELLAFGNLPAMVLRSCPLRAQKNATGDRRACKLCGGEGYVLHDRLGNELPMQPYRTENGCTVVLQNPHVLDALSKTKQLAAYPFAGIIRQIDVDKNNTHFTYGQLLRGIE